MNPLPHAPAGRCVVHRFHRILYWCRYIGALEVVCCPYRTQAPHLSGHMRPFAAHMREGAPHYLAFTWHGTLLDAPSLGYFLHLTFVTCGLTCVSKLLLSSYGFIHFIALGRIHLTFVTCGLTCVSKLLLSSYGFIHFIALGRKANCIF
jgi:hypothetical protein